MPQPLPNSYGPLPCREEDLTAANRRRPAALLAAAVSILAAVAVLGTIPGLRQENVAPPEEQHRAVDVATENMSRGPKEGVSEKSSGAAAGARLSAGPDGFAWSNAMLRWQRTGFHFQPEKNWMNDPDGPVYYKGWYHLFYQYNPYGAVWGNISWGHAVSVDLINWLGLPLAMVPDQWYDANGVWTGSATILRDGRLAMLYTSSTNESVQVQCLAFPSDPADPLAVAWTKHPANPVLFPPPGIGAKDFRDPTTAWFDPADGAWRLVIGSKDDSDHAGIALTYRSEDFLRFDLVPGLLHRVPAVGMWECVDFYPVATAGEAAENGVELSEAAAAAAAADGVKHVLKASMDDERHDYYAIGRFDSSRNEWVPDEPELDVGLGLRYDWGKFYASKTFFDPAKRRRVLWGWIGETDSEQTDIAKGWSSIQGIPRTVLFDLKTGRNLLQWPVEEVESLRLNRTDFAETTVEPSSVVQLHLPAATQLDIVAEFEVKNDALDAVIEADIGYNCSTSGGAMARGALGPFGLLVLANEPRTEQTAVYFYLSKGVDGSMNTHFCHDESRSSKANDIVKRVVGSAVPVLDGETLSLRVMVDHSIVESFAQGGRSCITSRVYPTEAIYSAAGLYLFNNATSAAVTVKSVTVWQMRSAEMKLYTDQ